MGELGKKLAERWLTLLVLPGAFYLGIVAAAVILGNAHALDVGRLASEITRDAKAPAVRAPGSQVLVLVAVLVGAAAVGIVAQALGALLEQGALATGWRRWPRPLQALVRRGVNSRRRRWDSAHQTWHTEYQRARAPLPADRPDPARRHHAARVRDAIAVERPDRPTWSGDRLHAAAVRLDRDHHLDLSTVWPYLWLALPEQTRSEIIASRAALSRAAVLGAWGVLYAALVIWWWPAVPIAVVTALTARHRFRAAADTYAQLLEAAIRLHATTLAARLGLTSGVPTENDPESPPAQALDRELGRALSHHLRTQLPSPGQR
ncbi:hypothetical protein ACQEU3_38360 [Spirillospora sp. CA-253888]